MTVQMLTRPTAPETAHVEPFVGPDGLDMDAIDSALDRGDLESVRRLLGIEASAWQTILSRL